MSNLYYKLSSFAAQFAVLRVGNSWKIQDKRHFFGVDKDSAVLVVIWD